MQTKNRQQTLTIVAVAAVALFAADKLMVSPLMDGWTARSKRIAELRKEVSEGERLIRREQALRSHWEEMRRNTLPNNTSLAEQQFFKALNDWEANSRVIVTASTPQWKHDADEYMTYECRVDASGNLGMVSRFLYEVERGPLALKLESIELGARDKDGQQINLGLQVSGLVLTAQAQ